MIAPQKFQTFEVLSLSGDFMLNNIFLFLKEVEAIIYFVASTSIFSINIP